MEPFAVDNDMPNVTVRLLPAATIAGKVRHSDGEPAPRLLVQAYRESYERNQHRYDIAARATTDDRGLLLTAGGHGGQIRGKARPGANVTLIPEPQLLHCFCETSANEWGLFAFGALGPGEYRLVAWFDEPPCDVWSSRAAADRGKFGQTLRIAESGTSTVTTEP